MNFEDLSPIEQAEYVKQYGAPQGFCVKCFEPVNNAEYDICQKCSLEEREYQQDVLDEQKKGGWA